MALFKRKDNKALAAEIIAELQKAGLNGSPYANSGYATASSAEPYQNSGGQGLIQVAGQAVPMERPGGAFGAILGPAAPLLPAPIDTVLDESGRAMPRKYEYQVAVNLNLTQTEVPFQVLKSLTEQCDIIHRCIEIRVSEIVKQKAGWNISDDAITNIMEAQNVSHAKAARIGRDTFGEEIARLNAFWENPYVASDRGWTEWITEALWQHFAFDQVCVYPRYTLGKKLIGFDVIDAPTIKILLDNRGDIPHPPVPAYQQVLWGFPRGEFTASPDADGSFYNGSGGNDEFLTDQMAVFVRNRRTWSPYGFSPVEEAIPAATLYLDRQTWMRSEYQNGSTPMTWMRTNSQELDHTKLAAFERVLNDKLSGSTSERHRIKVLPDGFDPVSMPTLEERFKSDYDEFIIKRIAAIFGVSPASLGIVPRSGLGGKGEHEGAQESVETVSTRPMENFIVDMINSLSRRFLGADKNVTFVLDDQDSVSNEKMRADAFQVSLFSGAMTLNDVRGESNMPLYDMPEADEPMIVSGGTPTFLKGLLEVDSQGETVGAATNEHLQLSNQGQSQEGKEPQAPKDAQGESTEASISQSKESATVINPDKAAEAKAFFKFASKPRRNREFEFVYHTPEEAEVLKAQITDTPKGLVTKRRNKEDLPGYQHRRDLQAQHTAAVQAALAAAIVGIKAAIDQAHASIPAVGTDISAIKSIANQAVQHNIKTQPEGATKVITRLYTDAANTGATRGAKEVGGKPVIGKTVKQLMDNAGVTIKNINDTTVTRISDAITTGMQQGLTRREIYTAVNALVNDPSRALTITITESSRAYEAALTDTWTAAGVEQFNWIAYATACPECDDMESNNPYEMGDEEPPLHPNCECDREPITPEFTI